MAKLLDLCAEDRHRVGNLIRAVSVERNKRTELSEQVGDLKSKCAKSLQLLRRYQKAFIQREWEEKSKSAHGPRGDEDALDGSQWQSQDDTKTEKPRGTVTFVEGDQENPNEKIAARSSSRRKREVDKAASSPAPDTREHGSSIQREGRSSPWRNVFTTSQNDDVVVDVEKNSLEKRGSRSSTCTSAESTSSSSSSTRGASNGRKPSASGGRPAIVRKVRHEAIALAEKRRGAHRRHGTRSAENAFQVDHERERQVEGGGRGNSNQDERRGRRRSTTGDSQLDKSVGGRFFQDTLVARSTLRPAQLALLRRFMNRGSPDADAVETTSDRSRKNAEQESCRARRRSRSCASRESLTRSVFHSSSGSESSRSRSSCSSEDVGGGHSNAANTNAASSLSKRFLTAAKISSISIAPSGKCRSLSKKQNGRKKSSSRGRPQGPPNENKGAVAQNSVKALTSGGISHNNDSPVVVSLPEPDLPTYFDDPPTCKNKLQALQSPSTTSSSSRKIVPAAASASSSMTSTLTGTGDKRDVRVGQPDHFTSLGNGFYDYSMFDVIDALEKEEHVVQAPPPARNRNRPAGPAINNLVTSDSGQDQLYSSKAARSPILGTTGTGGSSASNTTTLVPPAPSRREEQRSALSGAFQKHGEDPTTPEKQHHDHTEESMPIINAEMLRACLDSREFLATKLGSTGVLSNYAPTWVTAADEHEALEVVEEEQKMAQKMERRQNQQQGVVKSKAGPSASSSSQHVNRNTNTSALTSASTKHIRRGPSRVTTGSARASKKNTAGRHGAPAPPVYTNPTSTTKRTQNESSEKSSNPGPSLRKAYGTQVSRGRHAVPVPTRVVPETATVVPAVAPAHTFNSASRYNDGGPGKASLTRKVPAGLSSAHREEIAKKCDLAGSFSKTSAVHRPRTVTDHHFHINYPHTPTTTSGRYQGRESLLRSSLSNNNNRWPSSSSHDRNIEQEEDFEFHIDKNCEDLEGEDYGDCGDRFESSPYPFGLGYSNSTSAMCADPFMKGPTGVYNKCSGGMMNNRQSKHHDHMNEQHASSAAFPGSSVFHGADQTGVPQKYDLYTTSIRNGIHRYRRTTTAVGPTTAGGGVTAMDIEDDVGELIDLIN
ncbi:unnamed protein product [Amoebophrya sp. A25]|nr:unnamed protein product [Amoebophrya sp. A25]|eukprot:GSA25T00011197001.1